MSDTSVQQRLFAKRIAFWLDFIPSENTRLDSIHVTTPKPCSPPPSSGACTCVLGTVGLVSVFTILLLHYRSDEKEKGNQHSQKSVEEALQEKETALEEVASLEKLFSDLHTRYEKLKAVLALQRQNEEAYKKGFAEQKQKLEKITQSYKSLKQQAEEKLRKASDEIEKVQKSSQSEIAKLEVLLKRKTLQVEGLDKSVEQKVKEFEELTKICDELILKVGA